MKAKGGLFWLDRAATRLLRVSSMPLSPAKELSPCIESESEAASFSLYPGRVRLDTVYLLLELKVFVREALDA